MENLIEKDTDNDGVPDWEESLWKTDPNKKETTRGVSDKIAIDEFKNQQAQNNSINGENETENLTKTEQFSREFFATIVALNQEGAIDQATIDALGTSLALQIQNSTPQKIYTLANIKTTNNESTQAILNYRGTLLNIYEKHATAKGVPDIMQELINDEENMDILLGLDPIINQINKIINELIEMEVPRSLALLHLDLINISQRLMENISDIKLLDNDPILAVGAITQYFENSLTLELITKKLIETSQQKLNN